MQTFEERLTPEGEEALKLMLRDSGEQRASFEHGYNAGLSAARKDHGEQSQRCRIAVEVTQQAMCALDNRNRQLRWRMLLGWGALTICSGLYWFHMLFQHWTF